MKPNFNDVAIRLAGGHYYCDDSWYSCPLSQDGCADESQKECNCAFDERVNEIKLALECAYDAGYEKGYEDCCSGAGLI